MNSLMHLTGDGNRVSFMLEHLLMPNVVDVDLQRISFLALVALLSQATELRHASLSRITHVPSIYSPIHIPSVTSLNVSDSSFIHFHLETPSLEHFRLFGGTLTKLFGRNLSPSSYRNLLELRITAVHFQEKDLVRFFRVMPNLEILELHTCSTFDGVLRKLTLPSPEGTSRVLLPQLRRILLKGNDFSPQALIGFLSSRNSGHASSEGGRASRITGSVVFIGAVSDIEREIIHVS